MSRAQLVWGMIVGMGLTAYGMRLCFILLVGRVEVPPLLARALRFVPAAVLSAIVFPAIVYPGGRVVPPGDNPRLLAGALALLVAWRTRSVLLTIVSGMVTLWLLQGWQ